MTVGLVEGSGFESWPYHWIFFYTEGNQREQTSFLDEVNPNTQTCILN